MKLTSRRRIAVFGILSVVYACVAALIIGITSIRTCSVQPDIAADCDATPVLMVMVALATLYLGLAVWFFRAKLNGVD